MFRQIRVGESEILSVRRRESELLIIRRGLALNDALSSRQDYCQRFDAILAIESGILIVESDCRCVIWIDCVSNVIVEGKLDSGRGQ